MQAVICLAVAMLFAITGIADAAQGTDTPEPEQKPAAISPGYPSADSTPTVDGRPLQEVLNSKDYLDRLVRYLIGYETWINICTDAEPEERLRTMMVTEPVALPGVEGAAGAQWLEVIRIRGCEKSYERMIFATYHDGKPVFHAQLSGTSKTTPLVQHETLTALRARETDVAHAAGCDRADRARVLGANLDDAWDGTKAGTWREIWIVHSCKGVKEVPVVFKTSQDGTVGFTFGDE